MKDFVLLPWEHLGAAFNSKAHAEARLEIGGKKRNFLLKMRAGVIFFKEPSRGQVFAIPQIYKDELATDSIGLISTWQREVAAGNYGAFVAKREYFEKLPVRGQFLLIVKANGEGWMKEHFDDEWFSLPLLEKPPASALWNDASVEIQINQLMPFVKASLLQRIVTPEVRQADAPRWVGGEKSEFTLLLSAATQLFLSLPEFKVSTAFKIKSHSAFAKGEVDCYWFKRGLREPQFAAFWKALESQIAFIGVKWSEGGEQDQQFGRPRSVRFFEAGLEQWGENWRGNWAPQRGEFSFDITAIEPYSAHERLEAVLRARTWLRGKIADEQVEQLLQKAQF